MTSRCDKIQIDHQIVYLKSAEHMNEIPDEYIDVIITSPPYNRGKKYTSDDGKLYNDKLPEKEYLEFLTKVWEECFRKGTEKSVFFLNIGDSANDQGISEKVALSAEKAGWKRIQNIIWAKSLYGRGHYTPSGRNKRLNNIWENIFVFVKNKKKYVLNPKSIGIPYADKSNIGRYGKTDLRDAGNIWHISYEKTTGVSIKKEHEAPFPIGLPYRCLKLVPDAKNVLDPFLGTGTTLAAANNLNLEGYGYEKFPCVELIKKTIHSGLKYNSKQIILLPHFEETIKYLIKIIINGELNVMLPKSKKEKVIREIVIDTLRKMEIDSKLLTKLDLKSIFA